MWLGLLHCVSGPSAPPAPPRVSNSPVPEPAPACLLREGEGGRGGRPSEVQAAEAAAFGTRPEQKSGPVG